VTAATSPRRDIGTATYVTVSPTARTAGGRHWTDPANNGGSAITGYTVTANTGGAPARGRRHATTCTVTSG